ncbi:aspartate/glutamate racemase family protein [Aquisalibacillus elongatus]|uniref:Aspartate racemase n=1 Tax=Aquisalibacillus elongatus TaxID=485577 RepID=A0A3N5C425_9BACI|nr:amino acid racemase [Aquisalibacillus elongatus]RPF51061.1 aspartate racemase [Aquisalibacillus elongatus]
MINDYPLGVIGGMGPKATSVFYDRIIDQTDAHQDQDHLNMVILNHATMPDRTQAILTNQGEKFLDTIKQDFKTLENVGVSNIAIPCNTSHFYYEQLQAMTNIPIIHMVDETVRYIYDQYGSNTKVGILATNGTIRTQIYEQAAKKYQLDLYTPNEAIQSQVMNIIYEDVKGDLSADPQKLEHIIQHLIQKEQCQSVILACTELSCISIKPQLRPYTIDAMDVLVEQAILRSGKQLKNNSISDRMISQNF